MRLETLQLLPRGSGGWESGTLTFGDNTTLLLGPNGAGKTPLIKSLMYALGHPVELPPLIKEKCEAVRVTFFGEDGHYTIERQLAIGIEVRVTDPSGQTTRYDNERAFSEFILGKLGVPLRMLSGKIGEKIPPYMSVVGPMFLVDQDTGWTTLYVPFETHQFVKDQREEVMRWVLDVPARNKPVDKSERNAAKAALASIQEQITFKRRALEALQRELGEDLAVDAEQRLRQRQVVLEAELTRSQSVLESISQAESVLDVRVRDAVQHREQLTFRLGNAKRRKMQLAEVHSEVGAELGALEQNEIAADAFRVFCGNEACQFFRKPDDSYGRRVLYLKDPLKDFESSSGETERELGLLQQQMLVAEAAVRTAIAAKTKSLESGASDVVGAVDATSRELADVLVRLDRLERIAKEGRQLDTLVDKEARADEDVRELRRAGAPRKDNSRLLDARQNLASTLKEWLLALRTPNVPADVSFDEELRLTISGERFSSKSSHSGSTRTRIVLALHAAMVETSLVMNGSHPRLLVLDAPRQHELSAPDLRSYIERFHALSTRQGRPVQLVFSATDPGVIPEGQVDALWKPSFNCRSHFLGPPGQRDRT